MKNEKGKQHGQWKVIAFAGTDKSRKARWLCQCKCGKRAVVTGGNLRNGHSTNCGCVGHHGHCKNDRMSPTYASWAAMKTRCLNERDPDYPYYGGRGITVCKRWLHSFENFLADMGKRPKSMTLDRKNNNGNYTSRNCRWATKKQQQNNRRCTPTKRRAAV
jgi:hypothetical protein